MSEFDRSKSVSLSMAKSAQGFKFSKKFQGRGKRELELEKERGESRMCTEGTQGEPFQSVKAQRDKRRWKVGRTGVEHRGWSPGIQRDNPPAEQSHWALMQRFFINKA